MLIFFNLEKLKVKRRWRTALSKPTPGPGRLNDHVYRVLSGQGEHANNLKLINGVWKFKAIGYDRSGAVIPGWGI